MNRHEGTWYGGLLLTIRFLLELGALAALAYWGFRVGRTMAVKVALGIGAPLAAAAVWGVFVSPRAPVTVPFGVRLLLEIVIFGAAAVALAAAGRPGWALAYALVAAVDTTLVHLLRL